MLISFISMVWIVWAVAFCLGLCAAAARPMPAPDPLVKDDEEFATIPACEGRN